MKLDFKKIGDWPFLLLLVPDCIVAPYEADAQLAFLSLAGIADLIISEDSDLAPFGCDKLLCKMDITGNGILVSSPSWYQIIKTLSFRTSN